MVYFQTKTPNLGKLWSALQKKILLNFMALWSILLPFRIFYGPLVYFVVTFGMYVFPVLVCRTTKNLATLNFSLKKIRPLISFRVTFNSAAIKKLSLSQKRNVRPVFFVIVCKLSEGRSRHISSGHHCVRSVNGEKKRHFEIE
jgi:hypothetical protein